MRRKIAIAISIVSMLSISCILAYTDVYNDVKEKIVSVLCLSCIKMDPNTMLKFEFETVKGEMFPSFILENLSRGPVFLHFRVDVCTACDEMDPVIGKIFDVDDINRPFLIKIKEFSGVEVTLIHVNLDHIHNFRDIYKTFDIKKQNGVPMYVIITLGYDRGTVKPCYATGYGFLGKKSPKEAGETLFKLIEDSVDLYKRNREGIG